MYVYSPANEVKNGPFYTAEVAKKQLHTAVAAPIDCCCALIVRLKCNNKACIHQFTYCCTTIQHNILFDQHNYF